MDGNKYRSKGHAMANAGRRLPYAFLLLLALAAGVLSVVVLHKVREQRVFAERLQQRDRQLVSLRILLQKEKAFNRETKKKVEEMKATASSLRILKTDQKTKLKEQETTVANLKKAQKDLEAALAEKDNRINLMEEAVTNLKKARKELEATLTEKDRRIKQMEEKAKNATNDQKELKALLSEENSGIKQMEEEFTDSSPDRMAALMEILQQKEAELEEIKTRFQYFKKTDRADVNSKSTLMQVNNASAAPDIVVVTKAANSSSVAVPEKSEEKRSASSRAVESTTPEEKRPADTTVVESKRPKDRSLEEKPVKFAANIQDDGILQGTLNGFDEDTDFLDIYGESHSRKSGSSQRNKKFPSNIMDGIGRSENSLNQDSDRVQYSRLLEKEHTKADNKIKNNNVQGDLAIDAANVKPNINIPVNSDETKQQDSKQKRKRSKSKKKKMADIAAANVVGEFAKQRTPYATSISK